MDKGLGKLALMVGAVIYIVFLVFQLLSFMDNVGLMRWSTLSIVLQAALALPVLGSALGFLKIPVKPYTLALGGLAAVLAISGYLGMPNAAEDKLTRAWEAELGKSMQSIEIAQGKLQRLNLAIDLAHAEGDDAKKKIREEMGKIGENLSEADKKAHAREGEVLGAISSRNRFTNRFSDYDAGSARQMNGLVLIGVFFMVMGALLGTGAGVELTGALAKGSDAPAKEEKKDKKKEKKEEKSDDDKDEKSD